MSSREIAEVERIARQPDQVLFKPEDLERYAEGTLRGFLLHLDEQQRRFSRYPGVVEAAAELGVDCAFDLGLVAPDLPVDGQERDQGRLSLLRQGGSGIEGHTQDKE